MARKPNYRFERMERDRQKQAKKEERKKAKLERSTATSAAEDAVDALLVHARVAQRLAVVPLRVGEQALLEQPLARRRGRLLELALEVARVGEPHQRLEELVPAQRAVGVRRLELLRVALGALRRPRGDVGRDEDHVHRGEVALLVVKREPGYIWEKHTFESKEI